MYQPRQHSYSPEAVRTQPHFLDVNTVDAIGQGAVALATFGLGSTPEQSHEQTDAFSPEFVSAVGWTAFSGESQETDATYVPPFAEMSLRVETTAYDALRTAERNMGPGYTG